MSECRLCGGETEIFLDLGMQPLANKYPSDSKEIAAELTYKMEVEFCARCRSAQLSSLVDRELMFQDYYYLSSVNHELCLHFEEFVETKLKHKSFVLDIGSNDGILLKPLVEHGVRCLGVDPSENVGKIANDKGLETLVGFFNDQTAKIIKEKYGVPDAIVASSVFTHLETPQQFIKDLANLCAPGTSVFIEIEYLHELVLNLQFERFYFDRPHYYSVTGMSALFEKEGFSLIDVSSIKPHGGSIRLEFVKTPSVKEVNESVLNFIDLETENLNFSQLASFASNVQAAADVFKSSLIELRSAGKKVVGYGCPARLATITNFAGIDQRLISEVFEDSPLKANRFTPGMHIPIVKADSFHDFNPDVVIVFAYEYFSSIRRRIHRSSFAYFRPIPFQELIEDSDV